MRTLALALTGLLVLGALSPIVLADPERRDAAHSKRAEHSAAEAKRAEHQPFPEMKRAPATIRFSAEGTDAGNDTYDLSGLGTANCRIKENNETDRMHIHCRGTIATKVIDENGTVVKEGRSGLVLHARQNETGEWKWFAVSTGFMKHGPVKLLLRGDSVERSGDNFVFGEGQGRASFKLDDADERLRLKLSDGEASVERV